MKQTILGTLLITIGVIVAVAALITGIEVYCVNDSYYWMPVYPDAELRETEQQGYFRARGMGITEQTYYSPSEPVDVRAWYREHRRQLTSGQQNANADTAMSGFGINQYSVSEADGGGSLIRYFTQCGQ